MNNKKFELFDKFVELHQYSEMSTQSMIQKDSTFSSQIYDYNKHYAIKDKDVTKHRFCHNTQVSKQYEKILMKYSKILYPRITEYL